MQRGTPIICHWQIQKTCPCSMVEGLSDWAAVFLQSQAFTLPALESAPRGHRGEVGWDGTARVALYGLFSRAGHAAAGRSGVSARISVCVSCSVLPLEYVMSVSDGGEVQQVWAAFSYCWYQKKYLMFLPIFFLLKRVSLLSSSLRYFTFRFPSSCSQNMCLRD